MFPNIYTLLQIMLFPKEIANNVTNPFIMITLFSETKHNRHRKINIYPKGEQHINFLATKTYAFNVCILLIV